jgi:hypothetical protein
VMISLRNTFTEWQTIGPHHVQLSRTHLSLYQPVFTATISQKDTLCLEQEQQAHNTNHKRGDLLKRIANPLPTMSELLPCWISFLSHTPFLLF